MKLLKEIRKHFRYLWARCKTSMSLAMTYKASFFIRVLTMLLFGFLLPLAAALIYSRSRGYPGWNFYEYLLFLGFLNIGFGLNNMFISNLFFDLGEKIRKGLIDVVLIKPYNELLFLMWEEPDYEHIAEIGLGLFLIILSIFKLNYLPPLQNVLLAIVLMIGSLLFFFSFITIVSAISIIVVNADYLFIVYFELTNFARYPTNIFPGVVRALISFVIPYAAVAYLPASIFLGKTVTAIPFIILSTLVFFGLSLLIWRIAMRKYTSAGG